MSLKSALGKILKGHLSDASYAWCCRNVDRVTAFGTLISQLGFSRQCPMCNWRFRRFLSEEGAASPLFREENVIGGGPVDESMCPRCGSSERERHVYLYLREATDIFSSPTRILHIAPEKRMSPILARQKNVEYISGDLFPKGNQHKVDVTHMQFPDQSFDTVLCNHVLEHVSDDHKALTEMFRILRPGGWAMLQVPIAITRATTQEDAGDTDADTRVRLFGQSDHVRVYGRDYAQRLKSIGFEVKLCSLREQFGDAYAKRFGLLPDEKIYVAVRPPAAPMARFPDPTHMDARDSQVASRCA